MYQALTASPQTNPNVPSAPLLALCKMKWKQLSCQTSLKCLFVAVSLRLRKLISAPTTQASRRFSAMHLPSYIKTFLDVILVRSSTELPIPYRVIRDIMFCSPVRTDKQRSILDGGSNFVMVFRSKECCDIVANVKDLRGKGLLYMTRVSHVATTECQLPINWHPWEDHVGQPSRRRHRCNLGHCKISSLLAFAVNFQSVVNFLPQCRYGC